MTTFTKDPLLRIARLFASFFIFVFGAVIAACVVAVPLFLTQHAKITIAIGEELRRAPTPELSWAIVCLLLIIIIWSVMAIYFLLLLRRIIDSVGEGDPFIEENAGRLRLMAWLVLVAEGLSFPASLLGTWIDRITESSEIHFEISVSGILFALILFILARVFQKGSEMREELEGTV